MRRARGSTSSLFVFAFENNSEASGTSDSSQHPLQRRGVRRCDEFSVNERRNPHKRRGPREHALSWRVWTRPSFIEPLTQFQLYIRRRSAFVRLRALLRACVRVCVCVYNIPCCAQASQPAYSPRHCTALYGAQRDETRPTTTMHYTQPANRQLRPYKQTQPGSSLDRRDSYSTFHPLSLSLSYSLFFLVPSFLSDTLLPSPFVSFLVPIVPLLVVSRCEARGEFDDIRGRKLIDLSTRSCCSVFRNQIYGGEYDSSRDLYVFVTLFSLVFSFVSFSLPPSQLHLSLSLSLFFFANNCYSTCASCDAREEFHKTFARFAEGKLLFRIQLLGN